MRLLLLLSASPFVFLSCASAPVSVPVVEAHSLLGAPLLRPSLPPQLLRQRESELAAAEKHLAQNRGDADALIWVGRRTAYLGRYNDAVEIFTRGIELHPDDPRMLRHRGHRWITLRQLDRAISDLSRAAGMTRGRPDEIEPDGLPNARGIPTSSLQSNIWYHLALAHYLSGNFDAALPAWKEALAALDNPDNRVAASHWLYMTLRRLGREEAAAAVLVPITGDLDVIENHAYHRLLLMYRGELTPDEMLPPGSTPLDETTVAYGVGNWYFYNGDPARPEEIFRRIVESREWPAFGYIAAEAELARRYGPHPVPSSGS
jgi:tetratricopeptide (TPR) repeat protein